MQHHPNYLREKFLPALRLPAVVVLAVLVMGLLNALLGESVTPRAGVSVPPGGFEQIKAPALPVIVPRYES